MRQLSLDCLGGSYRYKSLQKHVRLFSAGIVLPIQSRLKSQNKTFCDQSPDLNLHKYIFSCCYCTLSCLEAAN